MTKTSTIAVDLAKSVFDIAAEDEQDLVVFRRRLSRSKFREFQGARFVAPRLATLIEDGTEVPAALLPLLAEARNEILFLDHRTKAAEEQLRAIAGEDDIVRRLTTIPGVGLLTATALVAAIGDFSRFSSGRSRPLPRVNVDRKMVVDANRFTVECRGFKAPLVETSAQ